MRICKIYDDDYPWDVRVEKVGRALVDGGHTVFLCARNRKLVTTHEEVDKMQVRRMKPISFLPPKVDVGLMFPAFFSPRWAGLIGEVVWRDRCDAILVRDLPLALTGVAVGKALGKPVVLDMAENYPAALRAIHSHKTPTIADHIVRNPRFADLVEYLSIRGLDHVIVVCKENRDRLIDQGVPPEKVSVVRNTPDLEVFEDIEVPESVAQRFGDDFVLMYVGAVDPFRGLDTVIQALPEIRRHIPKIKFAILGKGQGVEEVEALAQELGVADITDMVGFLPMEELGGYIGRADVCIVPHHVNEHINTTLPNKLYEYMASGRAVISTDAAPLERVIEETGCGVTYISGDPASLAQQILSLRQSKTCEDMGAAGRKAILEELNWGEDQKQLLHIFEQFEGR
jgi:glycosyltransferase involved in cell wall biosynthesis